MRTKTKEIAPELQKYLEETEKRYSLVRRLKNTKRVSELAAICIALEGEEWWDDEELGKKEEYNSVVLKKDIRQDLQERLEEEIGTKAVERYRRIQILHWSESEFEEWWAETERKSVNHHYVTQDEALFLYESAKQSARRSGEARWWLIILCSYIIGGLLGKILFSILPG